LARQFDNPPLNVMGPGMVKEFQEVINALEADEHVRVVVFDSAVDDYFLNHSDFNGQAGRPDLIAARSDGLAPLAGLPRASDAIAGRFHRAHPRRATGNGSEITLACDMSFASREKPSFRMGGWRGMVAGGGPWARLPDLIGRNRALEVLLKLGRHPGGPGRGLRIH